MYEFLLKNKCIETHYQKAFTSKLSGTFQDIAEMEHLINQSRLKQLSLVIALIDLRKAFGSLNYYLIQSVLKYQHIPKNIKSIIANIYNAFHISIIIY